MKYSALSATVRVSHYSSVECSICFTLGIFVVVFICLKQFRRSIHCLSWDTPSKFESCKKTLSASPTSFFEMASGFALQLSLNLRVQEIDPAQPLEWLSLQACPSLPGSHLSLLKAFYLPHLLVKIHRQSEQSMKFLHWKNKTILLMCFWNIYLFTCWHCLISSPEQFCQRNKTSIICIFSIGKSCALKRSSSERRKQGLNGIQIWVWGHCSLLFHALLWLKEILLCFI